MTIGDTLTSQAGADTAVIIDHLEVSAYKIPTDAPESDGTFAWNSTTMVVVHITGGGMTGVGYTYADSATATLIRDLLADGVTGRDAFAIPAAWAAMVWAVRNLGRPGVASMAIAAVDAALWDLKGRLLELPVVSLLGCAREEVAVYGSGGFTSYDVNKLQDQLGGWVADGIRRVKMKIGTHPQDDAARVRAARQAIGEQAELFVDANGAYSRKQALAMAETFADESGVAWFEEPVPSDDLDGLGLLRDRAPGGMEIAAGEYGYDTLYFRRMLEANAVDVLQADASRCRGITGFLKACVLAESHGMEVSAHCAPSLHVHPACAVTNVRHLEYFHDHDRIEHMLFDGAPVPVQGMLAPDLSRPGLGLEFKQRDADRYAI
jgi:L-alanine-DL-glutamate epimerase-like enolase superfamily enzyme